LAFLKLEQYEKDSVDAKKALDINPNNAKALFYHGLSPLHALKPYQEALPLLAKSLKLEPKEQENQGGPSINLPKSACNKKCDNECEGLTSKHFVPANVPLLNFL
jgi:tetratricopeptide (TPR) repeat protein